jgi:hypothetical protein
MRFMRAWKHGPVTAVTDADGGATPAGQVS